MPRPISWARRRLTHACSRDSGALSLELAIVFPAVMLMIFTIIQAGLWYHARNVALSAAQRGVERARVQGASLGDGTSVTNSFLDRAGASISGRSVSGSDGNTVTITVRGQVNTWIPGLSIPVDQHASAARERLTGAP
ncbi:pilus assembly protein [Kitasatospora sp. NBC_00240]|uniref:TadE family protein n=1 Tax=Kitasatospora sp. NBC_00240 TaxID=2903567 RepID=UPI00224F906D|nr:TadE/TadG family type IV pilus assembly protein [Kitasatospora sp. NBC_00240]MCX5215699.1 pilus assembly protein [Kitasatospora sp. NBC_00240]